MDVNKDDWYSLRCLNEGVDEKQYLVENDCLYEPRSWKTVSANEKIRTKTDEDGKKVNVHTGILGSCAVGVSVNAIGILEPFRGKDPKVHKLILLLKGVIDKTTKLGCKGRDAINIDHFTHPSDNRFENLRLVRDKINLMRKNGSMCVRKCTTGVHLQFWKPMGAYIRRHYTDDEMSEDLKTYKYNSGTCLKDSSQSSKYAAQLRKSRVGNAVLDFLQAKEPEIFNAKRFANGRVETFSILPELRTAFAPPPLPTNALTALVAPAPIILNDIQRVMHREKTTTTTTTKEDFAEPMIVAEPRRSARKRSRVEYEDASDDDDDSDSDYVE